MRVPQLAIHLDRAIGQEGLKLDQQQHGADHRGRERQEGAFRDLLAAEIGCDAASIKSWDAMLHDLSPSRHRRRRGHAGRARLDRSAYLGLEAVIMPRRPAQRAASPSHSSITKKSGAEVAAVLTGRSG